MKVILHHIHCLAKTESGEDEIYCVVSTGTGPERRQLARIDVGKFDAARTLRPDLALCNEANASQVAVTFMENDANEPGHGSDDFIGEITVNANGDCRPGRCTLDEGYDETRRYRQFSMTSSAAHYVVQLHIQP